MTGIDIDKKLETFNNLIHELGTTVFSAREIWQRQDEIAENFKAAQFADATSKEAATHKFEQLVTLLKEKEIAADADNEIHCTEAEKLIAELEQSFAKFSNETVPGKDDFKVLRDISNKTFEYFKQHRWTSKERRTTAWDKYNNTRNAIKDKEDELYARERDEKTKLLSQSLEITEKICVLINACHPSIPIEELQQMVNKFDGFLQENKALQVAEPWHLIKKPEDIKYSLRCRTETLNDIRNFITANKEAITREHKGQIFANMDALKTDLNKAWDAHKEEQEIKRKEREEKRVEWNKKQQDFLAFLEKRLENQIAYKAKQDSYLQSQKEYAKRFESRIPQQQEYIKKLVEQVIDLEKKYATAWTDSFKAKVEEWITEKKDKIASVEADIETLKTKVADIHANMAEFPKKIEELDSSIKEIQDKIVEVREKLANDTLSETTSNKQEITVEVAAAGNE